MVSKLDEQTIVSELDSHWPGITIKLSLANNKVTAMEKCTLVLISWNEIKIVLKRIYLFKKC